MVRIRAGVKHRGQVLPTGRDVRVLAVHDHRPVIPECVLVVALDPTTRIPAPDKTAYVYLQDTEPAGGPIPTPRNATAPGTDQKETRL
ncbi:MAG: hypothetical protein ACRDRO_04195 [Pseudonocardiaceae bacterium]